MLDAAAEWNRAQGHLTELRVVTAERDQLLAGPTVTLSLALADLRVGDDALHFVTWGQKAVLVATLARVDHRLDAALDAFLARLVATFHQFEVLDQLQ